MSPKEPRVNDLKGAGNYCETCGGHHDMIIDSMAHSVGGKGGGVESHLDAICQHGHRLQPILPGFQSLQVADNDRNLTTLPNAPTH